MADDLGAVLEAPETVVGEAVEQSNEDQQEAPEVEQKEQPDVDVKGDDRLLPRRIRDLKATDPIAYKEERKEFFMLREYQEKLKDFDLDGTKTFLEERGGREAIIESLMTLEGKAAEYDGWLQKIEAGDPSVLSDIPPESLAKLAPAVLEQYAQADPEAWGAAMSNIMASTISQNGVPAFLERMELNLEFGKTEEVQKMVAQLKGWAGSFAEKAKAPTPTPPRQTAKTDNVKSEREQWESEKFTTSLKGEVDNFRTPLIDAQLKSFIARRPGDTEAQSLAKSTIVNQVIDRMAADKDFQKALNALTARKDREGAMRLIKSRETAAINEIAPKVGRTIFGNPATEKPKQEEKPKPKPNSGAPMTPRAAQANKFDEIWG